MEQDSKTTKSCSNMRFNVQSHDTLPGAHYPVNNWPALFEAKKILPFLPPVSQLNHRPILEGSSTGSNPSNEHSISFNSGSVRVSPNVSVNGTFGEYPTDDKSNKCRNLSPKQDHLVETDKLKSKQRMEKEQYHSKNLVTERNRRRRIKDGLFALRALVPKISKMDRAAIVGDAIEYIEELHKNVKELKAELAEMEEVEHKKKNDELVIPKLNAKKGTKTSTTTADEKGKMEVQVEVHQIGTRDFFVKLLCTQKTGGFARLMEAMHSIGLQVVDANVTTHNGKVLNILKVEMAHRETPVPVSQGQESDQFFAFLSQHGMTRTEEGNREHGIIKTCFLKGMGFFGNDTNVVAIHQNTNSGPTAQARLERFSIFTQAVAEKCGGNANIKHAWYGVSKGEICEILSHGFISRSRQPEEDGYGLGVYLSPLDFAINGALSSEADENGLRHLLLCRVILGKMEEICPGSRQFQPSSEHFDSGVDNLPAPRRHIIWNAYMNSHIMPNYVVTFRAPSLRGLETIQTNVPVPTSPGIDIPALMSMLSNFLPRSSKVLIEKYHIEFQICLTNRLPSLRRPSPSQIHPPSPSRIPIDILHIPVLVARIPVPVRCIHVGGVAVLAATAVETPTGKPPSIPSPSPPLLVTRLPMTSENNQALPNQQTVDYPSFKLVIVGDGGTGKTTFVKRHLTGEFEKKYEPTIGVEVHPLDFFTNYGKIRFYCWDTAGQEKFGGLRMAHRETPVPVSQGQESDQFFAVLSQHGMTRTEEGNREHEIIKTCFLKGMGFFGNDTNVVAIHQNTNSSPTAQARWERFRIFTQAVEEKCGGNANIKHAWYGASKGEICEIMSHGFISRSRQPEEDGYGLGVYLSPLDFAINGALSSEADEHGLRHLLLCRVILGKMEEICPSSRQFQPSSEHFDSGVHNLPAPRRHIIWSAYMNSHIMPNYVVTFKAPSLRGLETIQTNVPVPTSPGIDIPALMSMLSNFLPRSSKVLIEKYHAEFQENKISQVQLIGKMRQLAGENLLSALIKLTNRNKGMKPLSIITKFKIDLSHKPSPIPPTAIPVANPSPIPIDILHIPVLVARIPVPVRCIHVGGVAVLAATAVETPTGKPPSIPSPSPPLLVARLPMTRDNNQMAHRETPVPVSQGQESNQFFAVLSQHGMTRTEEGNREHEIIKTCFLKGMGFFGNDTNVVAIHQNTNSSPTAQARWERFRIFTQAVEEKCGGNANIKHAWYGASKGEICEIMSHGFISRSRQPEEDGYGLGVYLSPLDFAINGALSSEADEHSLRHLLLCRVILGKIEEICPGSRQFEPSSEHFDSGVDNLSAPRRHIIWSSYMNSHIMPNYVVTFRAASLRGLETIQTNVPVPTSPGIDIPALMSMLSNFLPRSSKVLIEKYHTEFQENKISQVQLIGKMRQLAGENLLSALIKLTNRNKQL
ncbi:hypothetical protein RHGRI_034400 [Rhododendron griersonianum]|uniref:Poly [ADP-ribose] polymerase n=2 Tax=Magnoliopsida TaxID=3398 RepID=A0AAV6I379_9ERIC|nr:hypothetical protein RHGRI_034400 [Rhododendron griersonianum]